MKSSEGLFLKVVAALAVVGIGAGLYLGGWTWLFGPKQPPVVAKTPDPFLAFTRTGAACADGTHYVTTEDGKVFWLVAGKAVVVACADKFNFGEYGFCDARGGAYLPGEEHLWYLYKGAATQVRETSFSEISEEEHRVTSRTVHWAAMTSYARAAYDAGNDAGDE